MRSIAAAAAIIIAGRKSVGLVKFSRPSDMVYCTKIRGFFVVVFKPSGQRCRLKGSDILKRKTKGPSRRKAHETSQEVCSGEQTVLSSRTVPLSSLPETATAGSDLDGAHGDHAGRGGQTGPRRLPLPRPPMRGTPADLSQCEGRCAGITVVHVWGGYRAAGRTVALERAPDGG